MNTHVFEPVFIGYAGIPAILIAIARPAIQIPEQYHGKVPLRTLFRILIGIA
jgi:hypothetical protein